MKPPTIHLPHSGLTAPDTRYTVTSYKEHQTYDGVTFTATLRHNGKIIGRIENDGRGGPDIFSPNTAGGMREQRDALEAFAARCTDARGVTPDVELLLGDLVTEYQTSRAIARAAKRGNTLLRLLQDHESGDGPMGWASEAATTETSPAWAADRERLRAHLLGDPELAPHALA
ncbi:hypothetical protein [Actinoplanes aureus]|uniref:Uncharacterized protein n=1 Tax=Actinoplanes aureus TaxID=2792083 RepID=A0A931CJ00_9ACTN|nr:hypothetical protein [Actinoplanes aureus]MBG0568223.1 hypothetical protein [Actinoplanes aureus]